jgi:oxygen-dependent protoporphyrinogen oxidase
VGKRWPPADDYSSWAGFDDQDAASWCANHFGPDATARLIEPVLGAFLFQAPEEASRALPLAALLGVAQSGRARNLTLTRGFGHLCEALASRLDVRCHTPVHEIRVTDRGVRVEAGDGSIEGDRVILATTASVAKRLYPQANPLERRLLSTQYGSTIHVCLSADRTWKGERISRKLGTILFARTAGGILSSITVESLKGRARVPRGEMLSVMVRHSVAADLMQRSDDDIVTRVLGDVERYFPGISVATRFAHVVRWHEAMPTTPVGRSRMLAEYRQPGLTTGRVLMAGDYMGLPCADSAAETGIWAANRILSV